MGGGIIGVWPDFHHNLPRIFTRTPQHFHPVAYDPDGLELKQALWTETLTGREVSGRYGVDTYGGQDEVEVITYIDEDKLCTILNKDTYAPQSPIKNPMKLVPLVCVGNLGIPGNIFGDMEIKDAVPLMKEINYQMYLVDRLMNAMIQPTIFVKGGKDVPDDIAIGKGGVIEAGDNGAVQLLGPIAPPNAWWNIGQVLQNWFDLISDNPSVLRGEGGGSIVTGKGFNAQLGPIAARMQAKLNILMRAWEQAIRYALLMWQKFPNMKSVKASGIRGKMPFFVEAKPKDFVLKGHGMWTEIKVSLSAQSFIDRQGDVVEIMQLYQNELISSETAMDALPHVANKKRERVKIDRDRQWKAQGMAMANQMATSPATANVDIGAQERTAYGLERGFMGETPAMPAPEGQMPAQEETEDIVSVLTDFFSSIDKLKGRVWFGGDPMLSPEECTDDNPEWKVSVWVEDPQDRGTITRAAEKVPELYGRIEFINGEPSAEEPSVPVNGAVESPTSAPEELPEEGMEGLPPELAGMLA
jgi:hypothetical protein